MPKTMSGAAKSFLPLEPINIIDAPIERLQMIESIQNAHDFLLSIYAENQADLPKLQELKAQLNANKYSSFIEKDLAGRDSLRLHYVGRGTGVVGAFSELGAVGGAIHVAEKLANPVVDVAHKVEDLTKYITAEPARLLGALYLLGDVFYSNAGKGDSLEAKLMNASGVMALAQSAIYMAFARDGSEYEIDDIQKRITAAIKDGNSLNDQSLWVSPEDKQGFQPVDDIVRFVRKDPIKLGAMVQIGGQVLLATAGAVSIMHDNNKKIWDKDGIWDIARSATSITAWAMLQINEEHTENKTEWKANPLARMIEEVKDSPHKYASTINTAASLFGIKSSLSKIKNIDSQVAEVDLKINDANNQSSDIIKQLNEDKLALLKKRPNHGQIAAELTYLSGDLTMFFARKSEYGGEAAINTKGAAKACAHFIEQSELLMSETPLKEFVHNLSTYLAGRIVHEEVRDGKMFADEVAAETQRISAELTRNIFSELAEKQNHYEKAANIIARISDLYPKPQQATIESALIEKLSSLTGANILPQEMQQQVANQHVNFTNVERDVAPNMNQVSELIIDLTKLLPDIHAGVNANNLYQTMLDFRKPTAQISSVKLDDVQIQHMQDNKSAEKISEKANEKSLGVINEKANEKYLIMQR